MAPYKPILVETTLLAALDDEGLAGLKANGLGWVRPYVRPWVKTLRNPGLGTVVEITTENLARCVPIDSKDAQRLIRPIAVR
jgi:hypothetical protein